MKYLHGLVEELRNRVAHGSRIVKREIFDQPVDFIEEPSVRNIEILDERVVKHVEIVNIKRPSGDIFALDSSSRVVETPYVFIAIASGSIHSRFTGRGLDVPHAESLIGISEPCCKHISVIPEVEIESSFIERLKNTPGILASNPLGVPYSNSYDKQLVLAELRLHVENCLLEKFLNSDLAMRDTTIFIDGPLIHPVHYHSEARVIRRGEESLDETSGVEYQNKQRSELIKGLREKGVVSIGVVKRLHRSYYLSSVDPVGIGVGRINDEAYISAMILSGRINVRAPVMIGPIRIKHESLGLSRLMWYIVAPRRLYPATGAMGNFVAYRVELFDQRDAEKTLGYVLYDSLHMGSYLPLSILIVDKRVKKITSSITSYLLYTTGLSEEATAQYISIL